MSTTTPAAALVLPPWAAFLKDARIFRRRNFVLVLVLGGAGSLLRFNLRRRSASKRDGAVKAVRSTDRVQIDAVFFKVRGVTGSGMHGPVGGGRRHLRSEGVWAVPHACFLRVALREVAVAGADSAPHAL